MSNSKSLPKKEEEAIMKDLDKGISNKEIMSKHGITSTELGSVAFKWREKKAGKETKPAKKKAKESTARYDYYDLSGQVRISTPANFVIKTKNANISVVLYEPMIGIGFIPFSIYAKSKPGEKIWVNDRKIESLVLAGYNLNNTKKVKSMFLSDIDTITIRKTLSDTLVTAVDNSEKIVKKITDAKKGLPDFAIPNDARVDFGKIGVKEVEKYLKFFGNKNFQVWSEKTKKWKDIPDGKNKMLQYGLFIDNMDKFYVHNTYFNYLNQISPKDIDTLAKESNAFITSKGPGKGLFDPRVKTSEGNTAIVISEVISAFYDKIKGLSIISGVSEDDIRIWLMVRFYLTHVFDRISKKMYPFIEKGGYDIKNEKEDTKVEWFLTDTAWSSFIIQLLDVVFEEGALKDTFVLRESDLWLKQIDQYYSTILS